eukprot:192866_1
MSQHNIGQLLILTILFVVKILNGHVVHKCAHDEIYKHHKLTEINVPYENHPYDTTINEINNEHNSRRLLSPSTTSPIRISAYYDPLSISTTYLSTNDIDFIKSLMSATIRYYNKFVNVIPVSGRFYVDRCLNWWITSFPGVVNCYNAAETKQCGYVTIPPEHYSDDYIYFYPTNDSAIKIPGGQGILNTDLMLYVSYSNESCGSTTLAHATSCSHDQYGRPVTGTVNICPNMLSGSRYWKQDIVTMVHEVAHVLVMSPSLWSIFRDSNGDIIPLSSVIDQTDPMGDSLSYIISPKVRQLARDYFNCPTLAGLPLENNGGDGSALSHWDEKYARTEIMTAQLSTSLMYFSDFTVALMEDSGWYYVNYYYSEPFYWGKNAGCELWNEKCVNPTTHISNFDQFFCHGTWDWGCSYDYAAPAACHYGPYGYSLPTEFQYFSQSNYGGSQYADYCPFRNPDTTNNDYESVCWDIRGNIFTPDNYTSQNYAINSRCVDIIDTGNAIYNQERGFCFEHQCFGYDSINKQWDGVSIKISPTQNINCTRTDQPGYTTLTTKAVSSINGVDIKCPNIDAICGSESKPFECYWGDYKDLYNECICAPGYNDMYCDKEDRSIDILNEIPINLNELITKLPTVSPTEPISDILCVENFSILELNDIYIYDGIWNFYPRYKSPNNNKYLFWNIFTHWWMIYDEFDTMYYWALCNISEWNNDINACNGEWKIYQKDISETVREINAKTYYGLCNNNIDITTTTTTTQQPIITSATSDIVIKETETNVLPSVITTSLPTITTVRPSRYPTTPHPIRTIAPHPTVTVSSVPSVSVTTGKGDIGIDSLEILNTKKNENDISQEITNIITTDEEEDVFSEFMTSDFNGISDLKTKNTLKKWAEIDWVNFFFEGYIGWIFVSVLALIILLLICVVSSMTNCKICQRDYDYIGIDFAGGSPNYNNKTKTTNMGLNGKEDEIIVTDEYDDDDDDDDDDDEYNDEYNDEENESEIIDDTDGETDENIGGETDEDVQTITSDLL